MFNCILHFICVHYLVGIRIQLLLNDRTFHDECLTNNSTDPSQYVPLKSKVKSMTFTNSLSIFSYKSDKAIYTQLNEKDDRSFDSKLKNKTTNQQLKINNTRPLSSFESC